jgi:hypothetical protein
VHSSAFGASIFDALFFKLGWVWCGVNKKHAGTRYAELPFLHPVGSVCHVVHYGASECKMSTHNFSCSGGTNTNLTKTTLGYVTPNLCFCIQ